MRSVLEVCVDSTASALAAKRGGASRLELCADLIVGGTTPSLALVRQVKAETGLPVRALLRPRFGDFCYDSYELAQMEQLAAELVEAGADGIVTGVLTPEGQLDADAMRPIYAAARRAAEKAAAEPGLAARTKIRAPAPSAITPLCPASNQRLKRASMRKSTIPHGWATAARSATSAARQARETCWKWTSAPARASLTTRSHIIRWP